MPFKLNQNAKPMILGNIENDADRQMLIAQLANYGKTLDDVDVVSIEQAEERGYFENPQFLAYIGQMGFTSAEEMKATYERMRANGMTGNQAPNANKE